MLAKLRQMRKEQQRQKAKLLLERERLDKQLQSVGRSLIHLDRMIEMEGHTKPPPLGIVEGAEQVFAANDGKPMKIRQLTYELEQLGVETTSKRFGAAVYATIRASPKFVKLPDGNWQRTQDAPRAATKAWQVWQNNYLEMVKEGRKRKHR